MRVALLISGYLRSFKENLPLIKKNILEKFDCVDTYIHVTKNEHDDKYLNIINKKEVDEIMELLNPICIIQENNINFTEDIKKNNLLNSWIKYYKLNKIKKLNEQTQGSYDLVIKYRPDLNLSSENIFKTTISRNKVYIPQKTLIDKTKLHNKDDEYICDIFAFGDTEIMDDYFSIYEDLNQLMMDYGDVPETLLYHHLKKKEINHEFIDIDYNVILSMCNVFAISGDSGSGKTTLAKILKEHFSNSFTLECDRYHKWERGDENWNNMTHLNPEANYIAKMEDDVFNLKIKNYTFQVDYDHKTGKFTEKEKIDSSSCDNMIVCGLHSLFSEDDGIYDLKIFVDTDEKLKKFWKIRRDVLKRGYTIENSLNQIDKRKNDYQKYILPQREKSDIIIRFFPKEEIKLNQLDQFPDLHLTISIDKKHPLDKPIRVLQKNNIEFNFDISDEKYNKITFFQYKKIDTDNTHHLNLGNYYDYVLLFILSLRQNR